MPLFMDYHRLGNVSGQDARRARSTDLAIREKYGVRYLQYWVNTESGTVFCLTEGPDKETCELVHKLAHGDEVCSLIEVDPDFFARIVTDAPMRELNPDLARTRGFTSEFRTFLAAVAEPMSSSCPSRRDSNSGLQQNSISSVIRKFSGRELWSEAEAITTAVFDDCDKALRCARQLFHDFQDGSRIRIGLSAEHIPPGAISDSDVFPLAQRLTALANGPAIVASFMVGRLFQSGVFQEEESIRVLDPAEEKFVIQLFATLEDPGMSRSVTVSTLSRELGISQPQLYRKIVSLTGKNPNALLRSLRLQKALILLKQRTYNVTQVALEVGFSNPSYFSRCFALEFGCSPSAI